MTTPRYGDGSDVTFANFSKDALREGTFYKVTSLPSPLRAAPPRQRIFCPRRRRVGVWHRLASVRPQNVVVLTRCATIYSGWMHA